MCLGFEEHDARLDKVGTVVSKIVLCDFGGSKPATCKTVKHSITTLWLLWRQFRHVLDSQEYGNNICNFLSQCLTCFLCSGLRRWVKIIGQIPRVHLANKLHQVYVVRVSGVWAKGMQVIFQSFLLSFFRMSSGQDYQHISKECN